MQYPKIEAVSANSNATTIMWGNGESDIIQLSDIRRKKVFELLKEKKSDELYEFLHGDSNKTIFETSNQSLSIDIENNIVLFNGEPIESRYVVNKIIQIASTGGMLDPVENFLRKVYQNPSKTAIDELFVFVEETNLSLFEDGDIAAYKMVRADYRDIWSGSCDYSIGNYVRMPRNKVNDNRSITCSSGLHFCSKNYLPAAYSFNNSNRMILVKINPEHVVCIPKDYNNMKARACEILSFRDITNYEEINDIYERYAVVDNKIEYDSDDWWEDDVDPDEAFYDEEDLDDDEDSEDFLDEQEIINHIAISDETSIDGDEGFREDNLSKSEQKLSDFWTPNDNKPFLD